MSTRTADTIHSEAAVLRADAFYPADVEIRLNELNGKAHWRVCYFNREVARGEADNLEDALSIARASADEWMKCEIRNLPAVSMDDIEDDLRG